MCLFPKLIVNPKYRANKKNRGIIPPCLDKRVMHVPIGCNRCMECRKKKGRDWQVRMNEELRNTKLKGYFMTMTFSDESLVELENVLNKRGCNLEGYDLDNKIASLAVRRFTERWRKKFKKSVRHWLVTEIGSNNTERIHIHGIIWTNEDKLDIAERWGYGRVDTGKYVNAESVGYIVKYLYKVDKKHKDYVPKMYVSNGIGSGYLNRADSKLHKVEKGVKVIEVYTTREGKKLALPIYYRNKIWSDEERELLWLEKLDQEVRYINGMKIDISENQDEYFKVLEAAQAKNKWLGYGNGTVNWDVRRYEKDRRNLKKRQRQQKVWNMEIKKKGSLVDAF